MLKSIKKPLLFLLAGIAPIALYVLCQVMLCFYLDDVLEYSVEKSSIPVEVVFVTAPKDFETLPYSVASVRKYLRQPISKVVLISPKSDQAIALAKSLNMEYIDESTILDLNELKDWVSQNKLSLNHPLSDIKWYYQQFLKLRYHKLANSKYYLVVDADMVMQKPFVMVSDYKVHNFFVGKSMPQWYVGYQESVLQILGKHQFTPGFSYVSHMMCFDRQIVANMINHIETTFNTDIYKAAILAEQHSGAIFSEYQLYGVYSNFVEEKILTSYTPKSHYIGNRPFLFPDQYNSNLKKVPYVAYHHYSYPTN